MTIHIDPVSRQRISYQEGSGDLQYNVTGGSAISTQVIPKIGLSRSDQMNLGRSNELFGTEAGLMGVKEPDIGITGENIQTTNRVQIRRVVKLGNN